MPTLDELQKQHEARLTELLRELSGRSKESDWALARALIHRAVHLAAERKAGEFCAVATYLAEQVGHAHQLLHGGDTPHADVVH